MVRGLAALVVLVSHVRNLFFKEYQDVTGYKNWLVKAIYLVGGLGHQAVVVFFVLSGFFIGGSVLSALDRWSWCKYIIARLSRLYLVVAPALVLGFLLDRVGHIFPDGSVWYDQPILHFNPQSFSSQSTLGIFVGNLFFLQTIAVPRFATSGPLWSLANEFWYYVLFPLLAIAAYTRHTGRKRLVCLGLLIPLSIWLPKELLIGFVIWLMGALIHFVPTIRFTTKHVYFASTVLAITPFVFLSVVIRDRIFPPNWNDLLLGASFAVWLCALVKVLPESEKRQADAHATPMVPYAWTARLLSRCSFSVYAVHFPLLVLLRSALGPEYWQPTPERLVMGTIITLSAFLFGLAFSHLTEAHTDLVRNKLTIWVCRRTPSQVTVTPQCTTIV
jgi:peptidoglycan/LPS O-acetylase OafA/YrhL